jgi:glycosyltransferase involved in cell wall biosynthesis
MKDNTLVTVLINNYNYAQFLEEAVESVLSQTYQNYELVIVDDGSTDHSREILNEHYANHEKIEIIFKQNGGQLSCFNEGIKEAKGDIIFFLDADDSYKPNYLEEVIGIYRKNTSYDFIFCALEEFGNSHDLQRYKNQTKNIDFGITFLETLVLKRWVGMQTSGISVRKELLKKYMPIPYLGDWITRADDCIVYGASLAGANKYYVADPLVNYRIHGNNLYAGRKFDEIYTFKRELNILKLFNFFSKKLGYPNIDERKIINLTFKELKTKQNLSCEHDPKVKHTYRRIFKKLNASLMQRLKLEYKLLTF